MAIQLSLFGASIRSYDWIMRTYDGIITNLNFEVIFVGPNPPTQELPPNLHYIYATVKPVQCQAIGGFLMKGETWGLVGDDIEFSPYAWDDAYSIYKESNNYKTLVALRYVLNGVDYTEPFLHGNPHGNLPCLFALMSSRFFRELGGFHRDYVKHTPETDLHLRARNAGMILKWSDEQMLEYADESNPNNQWMPRQDIDLSLLGSQCMFEPFVFDETIYTINQGQNIPRPEPLIVSAKAPPSCIKKPIEVREWREPIPSEIISSGAIPPCL